MCMPAIRYAPHAPTVSKNRWPLPLPTLQHTRPTRAARAPQAWRSQSPA